VQHVAHALHRPTDCVGMADVALDQLDLVEPGCQVLALAGGKVVQHAHPLALLHEPFDDVGADKAGAAGDEVERRDT
jgi:hypothetical protein